jgi:acyl transferase domain-containing protein/acyl carrier protein/SAM-dependent methyltransferase
MYYQSVWESAKLEDQTSTVTPFGMVLLFDTNDSRYSRFEKRLETKVILVTPGESYQQLGPQTYSVNPNQSADYKKLLATLNQQNGEFPNHIIHLWSQEVANKAVLNAQLEMSLFSIFHLSQALLEQKPSEPIQLLYIYKESEAARQPQYAALSGFAKTIRLENPKLNYKTVATSNLDNIVDIVLTEFQTPEIEVRYEKEQRWSKRLQEFDGAQETSTTPLLKEQGVYLITGGAGGLGLIFAEYLAKYFKAKLVLTGRSELNAEQNDKIQAFNDLGASVIYQQADISNSEDVVNLITKTKSHFGSINGIIHSAGVIKDAFIVKKTSDEMEAVLAPKVYGTIYLDEATKNEPLDFLVLFSSVAGVLGNVGQCDYAYANAFMDNFAAKREEQRAAQKRFGKTLSINWPLWQSGGMQVDEQTEKMLVKSMGIQTLSTETGLEAFSQGLTWKEKNQFLVVTGYRKKLNKVLGLEAAVSKPTPPTKPTVGQSELLVKLQPDLLSIASAILKVSAKDIDLNEDISEYGFDSISFTEFANKINDKYQLDITPAIFFEYQSVDAFSQFLCDKYQDSLINYYQDSFKTVSPISTALEKAEVSDVVKLKSRFAKPAFEEVKSLSKTPIAIIGISGVMPQSTDLESFWQHLEAGDDLITEIPPERWDWQTYYGEPTVEVNKTKAKWGGFMPTVDKFDPLFFGISPREAELMDPQQRLFLETVWKTIEDAGYKASDLSGSKTGLFVGVASHDYDELLRESISNNEAHSSTGMAHSILANRISYLLNLHGPSEPIDTACSSSLVAIHRAVEAIRNGTCEMAIAGGVNVILTPSLTLSFSKAGMLCEDGRCKTFDKRANGYVRGEGVGAIWLKPLEKAQADGDMIYAVVKGTAENHGGHATSLTAPNPNAQTQLLISAFDDAQIDSSTVSYIEAHGTGTSLGDPIEINGLKNAFAELYKKSGKSLPKEPHCGLGSVKTHIGHLETAAGIAGVFKVLLAMKHKTLPGNLHFSELNPYIQLQDSPFYVVSENQAWTPLTNNDGQKIPRRAGVSSFGFGGANAHIVLEEYESKLLSVADTSNQLIVLSAKNDERLKAYAQQMVYFLEKQPKIQLPNLAYTLQVGREAMTERLALVVSSVGDLVDKLTQYVQGQTEVDGFYRGNVKTSKSQSEILVEGEAGEAFFRIVIEKKELPKLAQLWVSGTEIDWQLLYPNQKPQRISLPTYPFARERYWISTTSQPVSSFKMRGLHPLIDQMAPKLSLNHQGVVFQKTLNQTDLIVKDHQVHEKPILPGGGYLEMAYATAKLVKEDTQFKLARVVWLQPIAVLDDTKEVQIVITDNQEQLAYQIQSCDGIHATGEIHPASTPPEQRVDIEEIKVRCSYHIENETFYKRFKDSGIHYGVYFQGVKEVWGSASEALGRLELPKAFEHELSQYTLHPTLMDSTLQTIAGIGDGLNSSQPLLPFAVEELEVLQPLTARMYAYVKANGPQRFQVALLDETGLVCLKFHDFSLRALPYPVAIPSLFEALMSQIKRPPIETSLISQMEKAFDELIELGQKLLLDAFQRLGVFLRSGEHYETEKLTEQLNIVPTHARLFEALLDILESAGFVGRTGSSLITTKALDNPELHQDLKSLEQHHLIETYPDIAAHVRLLWVCLNAYPDILTGQCPATDIMFPHSSMELVEGIYKGNVSSDYFNQLTVQSVQSYIQARLPLTKPHEKIKILEVGAGTGGTSASVLDAIDTYREQLSYMYTDISMGFIQHGKQHYGQRYPFVEFGILNVETDVKTQGYNLGDFDIIIAANVLHATRNIHNTLGNIKALLKKHGCLILNEATSVPIFATLTFGLLEGWWLFEDEENRLNGSPLLSVSMWEQLLEKEGFERVMSLGQPVQNGTSPQHIIIAESNGEIWHQAAKPIHQKQRSVVESATPASVITTSDSEPVMAKTTVESTFERATPQTILKNEDRKPFIKEQIVDCLSGVLQIKQHEFGLDAPYMEFGVDSILAVEIIERLNEKLTIRLRTTDLFNYPTIRQLVAHIGDEFGHAIDSQESVNLISEDELFKMQPETHTKLDNDEFDVLANSQEEEMLKIIDSWLTLGDLNIDEAEQQLLEVL